MEKLSEIDIWVYFWTTSMFIFIILWLIIKIYFKYRNEKKYKNDI